MIDIHKSLNDQFLTYLNQIGVETLNTKLLLGFSGGVDSVALALFLKYNNIPFSLAHMNFQLRGEESNKDEQFVKDFAKKFKLKYYSIKVDTNKKAILGKKSIQMIARELRYDWFNELLKKGDYNYLCTAHHLSDHVETILFNLTKGTGIEGLHGILPKRGNLLRPLRFMTKDQIVEMVSSLGQEWREDKSNKSVKYSRNKIRHQVIPLLKEINPSFEKTLGNSSVIFHEIEKRLFSSLLKFKEKFVSQVKNEIFINIKEIEETDFILLFYFLKEYKFDFSTVENVFSNKLGSSAVFYSQAHKYVLHLTHNKAVLIENFNRELEREAVEISITEKDKECFEHLFQLEELKLNSIKDLGGNENIFIDEKHFPIVVRKVKEGDKIRPFGMRNGQKKVFDLLQDEKIPNYLRKDVLIIASKDQVILSVLGIRNSESLRITKFPCKLIKITMEKL